MAAGFNVGTEDSGNLRMYYSVPFILLANLLFSRYYKIMRYWKNYFISAFQRIAKYSYFFCEQKRKMNSLAVCWGQAATVKHSQVFSYVVPHAAKSYFSFKIAFFAWSMSKPPKGLKVNTMLALEVWNKCYGNCKLSPTLSRVQEQKDVLDDCCGLCCVRSTWIVWLILGSLRKLWIRSETKAELSADRYHC